MKQHTTSTRFLRVLIAAGYLMMCLLAGGIMYLWFYEWQELDALETENKRINGFRREAHHVYGEMTGLSLLGESVLEWEDEDLEHYHVRRMVEKVKEVAKQMQDFIEKSIPAGMGLSGYGWPM